MTTAALGTFIAFATTLGVTTASAKGSKYSGPAVGQVTCHAINGKVKLSPPLKNSTGGSSAAFKIKVAACSVSGLPAGTTETISNGKASGSAREAGTGCSGLAAGNNNPITLTIKWKGTYDGRKAKFTTSAVTLNGFAAAFNAAQDAGFEVPNPDTQPNGGNVSGSFAGTVSNESTVYSSTNITTLGSECGSKKGIKKLALTSGSISIP